MNVLTLDSPMQVRAVLACIAEALGVPRVSASEVLAVGHRAAVTTLDPVRVLGREVLVVVYSSDTHTFITTRPADVVSHPTPAPDVARHAADLIGDRLAYHGHVTQREVDQWPPRTFTGAARGLAAYVGHCVKRLRENWRRR